MLCRATCDFFLVFLSVLAAALSLAAQKVGFLLAGQGSNQTISSIPPFFLICSSSVWPVKEMLFLRGESRPKLLLSSGCLGMPGRSAVC
jgi:hypothetical protein